MLRSAVRTTSTRGHACRRRCFSSTSQSSDFKVAAIDNGQLTTSITLLLKAGTRYETKAGVTHALKTFGFKNTAAQSALGIVRHSELCGGLLSAAHTREYISYTADFLRGNEDLFVQILSNILTATRYTPWEFNESVLPSMEAESLVAFGDPAVHAIDVAHALAFRSGLGRSLFAPLHPALTVDDIAESMNRSVGKDSVAFVGTGISHEALAEHAQKVLHSIPDVSQQGSQAVSTTGYFGGESRLPFSEHAPHAPQTVFVGFGIPGQPKPELAVLSAHLSTIPSIKWSTGLSPLSASLPRGSNADIVHLSYSDATLFGILIQGKTAEAVNDATKTAIKVLQDAVSPNGIKRDDLNRATAKAKLLAATTAEGREGLVATVGAGLLSKSPFSLDSVFASLDKVQASSISETFSQAVKSKPTFVAIGDTYHLPHLDETGFRK